MTSTPTSFTKGTFITRCN